MDLAAKARSEGGFLLRPSMALLRLEGGDPRDLLHKVTTQALERREAGEHAPAALLTPKGRIVATGQAVLGPGPAQAAYWTTLPAAERAQPVLARYGMLLDVEVELAAPAGWQGRCVGERAEALLAEHGLPVPEPGRVAHCERGTLLREDVGVVPAFWLRLHETTWAETLPQLEPEAYDALRIVEGGLEEGIDFDDETLFNVTGLETHVSWSKGCYPGQEPVVMAKHRGHPPQHLVRLQGEGAAPDAGALLHRDARKVGVVTSVVGGASGWRAIGRIAHAAAIPGERVDHEGGEALVVDRLGESSPQA